MQIPEKMAAYAAVEQDVIQKITLPVPEPDDYEVLVKNEGCVFCNTTDKMIIHNLYGTPDYPVTFGHENFGKVVKIGKKVKKYKLGDRVICANAIVNGYNGEYYSTWGGFAEYGIAGDLESYLEDGGVLDAANEYRSRYAANFIIPGDLSYDKACLAFPLSEGASALQQAGDLKDKNVVIIGTGVVGYSFCYFAKVYGAKKVVCLGIIEERLETAKKLGADAAFIDLDQATEYIRSIGGADVVCECSGNWRALDYGLPYMKEGGILAMYSVVQHPHSFNIMNSPKKFSYRHIDPRVADSLDVVCELLRDDKIPVDIFLSHKWSFDEVAEGYVELCKDNVIKGLVVIDEEVKTL